MSKKKKEHRDASHDAFSRLKNDHREIERLFRELEETDMTESQKRDELFPELATTLTLHAELEEKVIFSALEHKEKTRKLALDATEKHQAMKALLDELSDVPDNTERWGTQLKTLHDVVAKHMKEEEGKLFSRARHALSKKEREELAEQMELVLQEKTGDMEILPRQD